MGLRASQLRVKRPVAPSPRKATVRGASVKARVVRGKKSDEERIQDFMLVFGYDHGEASAALDRAKGLSTGCRRAEK